MSRDRRVMPSTRLPARPARGPNARSRRGQFGRASARRAHPSEDRQPGDALAWGRSPDPQQGC